MIKSMTGFGTSTCMSRGKKITLEIKSVNHRYSDISVKVPRIYSFVEEPIRETLSEYISRGKVDVFVNIEDYGDENAAVVVNEALLKCYLDAFDNISEKYGLTNDISVMGIARLPDVFNVERLEEDQEAFCKVVLELLKEALAEFMEMREKEGERLKEDMLIHLNEITKYTSLIEERAPMIVSEYRSRLEARMEEILQDVPVDEYRLLNEVAIFADRVNVNEEIIRLKSHIKHMYDMLGKSEPVGRKLDFIIQEMNREINTIASKTNDSQTVKYVIEVKSEIEKLREQAQNIE